MLGRGLMDTPLALSEGGFEVDRSFGMAGRLPAWRLSHRKMSKPHAVLNLDWGCVPARGFLRGEANDGRIASGA